MDEVYLQSLPRDWTIVRPYEYARSSTPRGVCAPAPRVRSVPTILYAGWTRAVSERLATGGGRPVKQLVVFDLDGTLAASKSSLDTDMAALLHDLLAVVKVAVISGGDWPQFEKQLLSNLPLDERLANLSLLPTCGTKFFQYAGEWTKIYSDDLTVDEKETIV